MVLRIGHRGAAGHEPENTLLSLNKAVELGCDMTEIDVHVCASGEVVVIHDEEVYRTTNGTGFVSQMSLDALKALDAGKGESIPTLEEVLSALKGRIQLNIELKGEGTPVPVHFRRGFYVCSLPFSFSRSSRLRQTGFFSDPSPDR